MEGSRIIDNVEVDGLREEDIAKEEEKRQRGAARATRGGWVMQGWRYDGPEGWCGDWYQRGR